MTTTRTASPATRTVRWLGIVLALEVVGLVIATVAQDPAARPVSAALGDAARETVSQVDVRWALVVVVALAAVARLVAARLSSWLDPLLTIPVTLFVVAQLNGITDLGALVGVYALASAGVLLAALDARVDVVHGHPRLPLCFAAAVGIVPWGIVAFHQVGAGIVGHPLSGIAVVVTLVALVFAVAEFVAVWRRAGVVALILRLAGFSAVAWLVVAGL
ncbi:hypothetical protein [Frondihabitans peucedani]|uniref:Yip1 domain-containing protein n=1 Tax=Frondihabitans peucedani TaxID=598626 RepID=A0ABP8E4V3_9MICO